MIDASLGNKLATPGALVVLGAAPAPAAAGSERFAPVGDAPGEYVRRVLT